jgi:hypothetical protein
MERAMRIELTTYSLGTCISCTSRFVLRHRRTDQLPRHPAAGDRFVDRQPRGGPSRDPDGRRLRGGRSGDQGIAVMLDLADPGSGRPAAWGDRLVSKSAGEKLHGGSAVVPSAFTCEERLSI